MAMTRPAPALALPHRSVWKPVVPSLLQEFAAFSPAPVVAALLLVDPRFHIDWYQKRLLTTHEWFAEAKVLKLGPSEPH